MHSKLYFNNNKGSNMSLESVENKFKKAFVMGNIETASNIITQHKSALKLFGARVWSWALTSKNQKEAIELLIKSKAPVFLPNANSKRFTANSDYTLLIACKELCKEAVLYLVEKYKIPQRLLSDAIAVTCNVKHGDVSTQKEIITLLIEKGGDVTYKNNKAIFNATFNEKADIIPILIDNGAYLINQMCAVLYLNATNKDPFVCLTEMSDERSQSALMEVMATEKVTDKPLEHYAGDN